MISYDPYRKPDRKNQNNRKKPSSQAGRETIFAIIHVEKNTPEAICIDLIAANNELAATTAAKRLFPNSTILRISASDDGDKTSKYPDARFIKCEFRPVDRAGDTN